MLSSSISKGVWCDSPATISVNKHKCCHTSTSARCVTRKLDLDQTSIAHKRTERHKCYKTHFSVRPHDFLHPSPVNSALYVVIIFVLVCLCRFLCQIILLTYMIYKLVAHFDLSLDLFQGDFWISLFSNSLPPLNLNKFSEYCNN